MHYAQRGSVPRQRHTQHRAPDGSLYAEELFGVEGFAGRSSLLYHLVPPTQTHHIESVRDIPLDAVEHAPHRHRLVNTAGLEPRGDVVDGRLPLFFNRDVTLGVVLPARAMPAARP
ncbi:MAG: homogentisate 1,2-dioxygenase, partial [Candidatus Limnocylindrales bacterium]